MVAPFFVRALAPLEGSHDHHVEAVGAQLVDKALKVGAFKFRQLCQLVELPFQGFLVFSIGSHGFAPIQRAKKNFCPTFGQKSLALVLRAERFRRTSSLF